MLQHWLTDRICAIIDVIANWTREEIFSYGITNVRDSFVSISEQTRWTENCTGDKWKRWISVNVKFRFSKEEEKKTINLSCHTHTRTRSTHFNISAFPWYRPVTSVTRACLTLLIPADFLSQFSFNVFLISWHIIFGRPSDPPHTKHHTKFSFLNRHFYQFRLWWEVHIRMSIFTGFLASSKPNGSNATHNTVAHIISIIFCPIFDVCIWSAVCLKNIFYAQMRTIIIIVNHRRKRVM